MKKFIYVLFMFATFNLWACSDSEPSNDGGEEVVDKTTDCQSASEKGAYTTWYKPANGWVGDPIPYYDDGKFYIFYLQDWRSGYPSYIHGIWFIPPIFLLLLLVVKPSLVGKKKSRM